MSEVTDWDGDAYDAGFRHREESGDDVHGEARLVRWLAHPRTVLDAGCGTGRVAIELSRKGVDTVGVDLDPGMLAVAHRNAPDLDWRLGDLSAIRIDGSDGLRRHFDVVVAAGNVMIFVARGTEGRVLTNLVAHLAPGGLLVTGFQILPGGLDLPEYDALAASAGLELAHRWSTWNRDPFTPGGDYAVSVHRPHDQPAQAE